MAHLFPSEAWGEAYKEALDGCPVYRDAARTWRHGAIALVIDPDPDRGLPDGFALWLDVEAGRCRAVRAVGRDEARAAPFCIHASYERWRAVIGRSLDPIAGMVTRRLRLEGDLLTMLRYVRSAKAMVRCASAVPSRFVERAA